MMRRLHGTAIAVALVLAGTAGAADYFVSPNGCDKAEGTLMKPWRTIQHAADVAKAGDVVTIRGGTYREWVKPANAGRAGVPIVYQAAKGEKVVITGADPVGNGERGLGNGWKKRQDGLWTTRVRYDSFGGLNPFTDFINGDWFNSRGPCFRTRLIQDGKPLELHTRDFILGHGGQIRSGHAVLIQGMVYGTIVAAFDKDPNVSVPELIVRPACFYPVVEHRDYITLRGITFVNAGPNWAPPTSEQTAIVGTNWSKGWVIEDCEVHGAECSGITLGKYGDEFDNVGPTAQNYHKTIMRAISNGLDRVGHHLVRRCRITDCGQVGICGSLGAVFSTIDDCDISYCHWKKPYGGAEMGGIKIHGAVDFTVSNCRIHHCGSVAGIWLDWMAQGTHIVGNRFWANSRDLYFEVNHGPILVEGNDFLSGYALNACSQSTAFVGNRILGYYRYRNDKRRTPIFKPHSVALDSLDKVVCGQGAFIFINNILGNDPHFKDEAHASRYENNWMIPAACWEVDETTGACTIMPHADSRKPDFKPVAARNLGQALFAEQSYPELVKGGIPHGIPAIAVTTNATDYVPPSIVFDVPAADENGVMVLGNGEVGATAWIGEDGTLHTVLQRTDSWNEGGQHVKVGAIDYETGARVDAGTFRQVLSLASGTFEADWKSGGKPVSLHYRVQNGREPFVVCDVRGAQARAKVVNWRLWPEGTREMSGDDNGLGNQFPPKLPGGKLLTFAINSDQLVPGGWCHVNRRETVDKLMGLYDRYQATADLGKPEFLKDRAFGGVTREYKEGNRILFVSAVSSFRPCKDAIEWLRLTNGLLDEKGWGLEGEAGKRAAHKAAWEEFWARSHIEVTPSGGTRGGGRPFFEYPYNPNLPVSYGRNSRGGNVFSGTLEVDPASRVGKDGLFFKARFNTNDAQSGQRLFDNVTPNRGDGSLVDLYRGRLRLLVRDKQFYHPKKVASGRDVSIQVTVSPHGDVEMVMDGVKYTGSLVQSGASGACGPCSARTCAAVMRAWAAQRYVSACVSSGTLPNRFNGSLFTISHEGNPDYRRWGNGYWWQNTRLTYYPMFAAGDFDLLQPLFRLYVGLADFNCRRTKKYLGHGGAFFPECMQPWGDHFTNCYGMRDWAKRADKLQDARWHKYEWVGQLELCLMLLDYRAWTLDDDYFAKTALPAIREYVRYFDEHYGLDASGRYLMTPSQACETWWDCTNPMPEIAGLHRVVDRLLALPDKLLADSDRELFARIRTRIPDLPTRRLPDGRTVWAAADKYATCRNGELPELYCVFPFRLCSFEKPNAEQGRATYAVRSKKSYVGWCQDELFAAYLGMAEEAQKHLVDRVLTNSPKKYRWPAYWGPNYNWMPDQDAGGNIQNILQSMLMQCDDGKIYLAPAWPKTWNCSFRLHAPGRTRIEGRIEDGTVKDLVVTPASRRADVVIARNFTVPKVREK